MSPGSWIEAPSKSLVAVAVAASVVAVSTAAILIRLSDAPALAIAFYRLLYATLLLLPFAAWKARGELAALTAREWAGLGAVGVVLALHFASWITSLSYTSVASSVFLVTLHPVIVTLASARLFGEGVRGAGWFGIGIALAGGVVITWGDAGGGGSKPLLGDALALTGAVAAAAYFLAGRGYRRRLSLLAYVIPVYGATTVALGLAALAADVPLTAYPAREHAIFLALAVVPMILGHTVINWALRFVTAPVIATTILGEPVGATILAAVALQETPPALSLAGGALVVLGIGLVVALGSRRPPGEAAPSREAESGATLRRANPP